MYWPRPLKALDHPTCTGEDKSTPKLGQINHHQKSAHFSRELPFRLPTKAGGGRPGVRLSLSDFLMSTTESQDAILVL